MQQDLCGVTSWIKANKSTLGNGAEKIIDDDIEEHVNRGKAHNCICCHMSLRAKSLIWLSLVINDIRKDLCLIRTSEYLKIKLLPSTVIFLTLPREENTYKYVNAMLHSAGRSEEPVCV